MTCPYYVHGANRRCFSGRGDSPRISPEESASRIRDWLCSLEKSSGLSAAQQNRLDSTTASLGASSLVTRHDGMLDELDELLQSAESHKK